MSLARYKKKRDFTKTKEPTASKKSSKGELAFVVQRHYATRLHYDFRLEMEGALKSWAVPKGPSMNPNDKRLAMMVEDHPYDYKNFYGTISKGNYGAGQVEIWDEGTYTDIDQSEKKEAEKKLLAGLHKGDLKFILHGKKLKGEFVLVKLRNQKENSWLLIKHRDQYAIHTDYNIEKRASLKVKKQRKTKPANNQSDEESDAVTEKSKPASLRSSRIKKTHFIKPMLAKEIDKPFNDSNWIFEIKWDGYRAIAEVKNSDVDLYSRNGLSFNNAYPIVVAELSKMKLNAVLDGEVVVLNEKGVPSFQLLQQYGDNPDWPLVYYVFDVLKWNGKDLTNLSLLERKEKLNKILKNRPAVRYCDHIEERGIAFFQTATKQKLEGIMAKKKDSAYLIGTRTSNWLKIKNQKTDEAIIIGYTAPRRSRKHFGSLLLGHYIKNELKYMGHVGTGFNDKILREVFDRMQPLRVENSPLKQHVKTNSPAIWLKPKLVAAVRFTERTSDGQLRQPAFLGLREDLSAKEVRNNASKEVKTVPQKNSKPKRRKK